MADNVTISAGFGTPVASDDIGGVQHQRVKVQHGADGSATDVSAAAPFPAASVTADFVVNTRDGSGNILTYTENGVDRTITRDVDGLIVSDLAD